jgi:pyroglutamyl-peptidase
MPTLPKVLLTGFEPFAGATMNPSQEIVRLISANTATFTNIELHCAILPVEYSAAEMQLIELAESLEADFVISLGQAEGRTKVSFEKVAINLDDAALADNSGETRTNQPISASDREAYFSSLPIEHMLKAVKAVDVSAAVSLSAGSFVCNHVFYTMSAWAAQSSAKRQTKVRAGFIHVPLIDEQAGEFEGKPTMPLNDQVAAIRAALGVLGRAD